MLPPGSAAPALPQTRRAEAEAFDLNPPVVLMKGTAGEPYFISWRSQKDVIQELALRSAFYIWGGPILAVGGLWLVVEHLLAH